MQSAKRITVRPFGLFKKKASDKSAVEQPVERPASDTLTIQQARDLLQSLESQKVKELSAQLAQIKDSATKSLKAINALAEDMEREKIKFEGLEHRLKSVVENSKKTVVSSLRRDSSLELPLPQSVNDAKKFKEKFEAMMKRFGEVSGSHSKVLNAFMKKHSDKMKEEFEVLTKLLNETKTIMSEFDQNRTPIVKCSNVLNIALQKMSSIKLAEASAQNIEKEIENIERELEGLESEVRAVRSSKEFEQAALGAREIAEAERRQEEFHAQIRDLFSHLARAFTKYSYGITKQTESRLQMMSDEPWKIIYENDVSPYSLVLFQIRKSIDSGKIQLKDSDKVLQYLDTIVESLPELQAKSQALKGEIDSLRQRDTNLVYRVKELEENAAQYRDSLTRSRQNLEQHRRQANEKRQEVDALLTEAGKMLADLTGKTYSINITR
jgi:predicted  nucleic acid-binding Zn-ribbon protein